MAANATGEAELGALRMQFDRSVKVEFRGAAISSDGGLLLHHVGQKVLRHHVAKRVVIFRHGWDFYSEMRRNMGLAAFFERGWMEFPDDLARTRAGT